MRVVVLLCALVPALAGCGPREEQKAAGPFTGKTVTTYDEAMASAKADNKPILVFAYQGDPSMFERNLLNDPVIVKRSGKFITAKLDAATQSQALSQLRVTNFPAMLILKPDGTEAWRSQSRAPFPGEVAMAMDQMTGGPAK